MSAALLVTFAGFRWTSVQAAPSGPGGLSFADRIPAETRPLDKFLAAKNPPLALTLEKSEDPAGPASITYTSQSWHGADWSHRLKIYRPKETTFPDAALVLVMGFPTAYDGLFGQLGATASGATCAVIDDVPNQPIDGKTEDALLADSLDRMLESGDPADSIVFPMTKSIVRGMDAVQQWSGGRIKRFILIAPSKRAWAVWLAAAEDKRVTGFIPIGYNNLRVDLQIPNQKAEWGEYSSFLKQYTNRGLAEKMLTGRGKRLMDCLDPFTFRHRLNKPKLIIDSTNNGYWTLDALNVYWDKTLEPADLLYIPNAGHYMEQEIPKVFGSIIAWSRLTLAGEKRADKPLSEQLWYAHSASMDFRTAEWESLDLGPETRGKKLADLIPKDAGKPVTAWFVAREYPGEPQSLRVTSSISMGK